MAVEAIRPVEKPQEIEENILNALSVRYYEPDGAGVIYDDQFYLYNEYGERVPETVFHSNLNRYLFEVLRWRFREQLSAIFQFLEYRFDSDLSIIEIKLRKARYKRGTAEAKMKKKRVKLEPDLAIFLGTTIEVDEASFTVGEGKELPAPVLILETASKSTYERDLDAKFRIYQDILKAKEYIVFDPHLKRLWEGPRLKAWRLENNQYVPLEEDEQGRLWSEVLQSWLVEENRYLRLYDKDGNLRLTELEHTKDLLIQAETETEQERAEKERERAEKEVALRRIAELEARLKAFEADK